MSDKTKNPKPTCLRYLLGIFVFLLPLSTGVLAAPPDETVTNGNLNTASHVWDLTGSGTSEQFAGWGDFREDSRRRALYSNLPDLTIKSYSVNWSDSNKKITIEVINRGRGDAGEFLVYLDAHESSSFAEPVLAQRSFTLNSLNSGASQTFVADFSPLADEDNNFLIDVRTVIIHTDSKVMVEEDKEANNLLFVPIP